MGFHYTLTLLFSFAVFALIVPLSGPLVTCLYSLLGGVVFPTASFLHDSLFAAFRLLGVSMVLLLMCYALDLRVSSSIPVNQLFLLGLLLVFSGGSILAGTISVFDPINHIVVLWCSLNLVYRLVDDFSPLPSAMLVTFVDAAVQVQSIPAPPVLMQIPVLPYMLPRPSHLFPVMPARLPNVNFHSQPECDPLSIPLLSVPVPGSVFGLDDDAFAWEKPSSLDLLFVDVLCDGPFISLDLMRWVPPAVLPPILRLQLSLALYSIPGWLLQRYVFPDPYLGSFEVVYESSLFFQFGSSSAIAYSWHTANSNQYIMKRLAILLSWLQLLINSFLASPMLTSSENVGVSVCRYQPNEKCRTTT